jgi:hypothetical protein
MPVEKHDFKKFDLVRNHPNNYNICNTNSEPRTQTPILSINHYSMTFQHLVLGTTIVGTCSTVIQRLQFQK